MNDFVIIKRNGQYVPFDPAKIRKVVLDAGTLKDDAELIIDNVVAWMEKSGKNVFTTLQLRDQVLVQMQKIDHEASKAFVKYEMFRDKKLGSREAPGDLKNTDDTTS